MSSEPTSSIPGADSKAGKDSVSTDGKIAELFEYFSYYLTARIDAVRLSIRRRIFVAALVLVAVLTAAGMIVAAGVLICYGISGGLAQLFHSQWIGELVTGLLVLAAVAMMAALVLRRLFALSHAKRLAKYQTLRERQKVRFGRDVAEQAGKGKGHA
jgi:membrane protein implicated in regulation of membrane protease activity